MTSDGTNLEQQKGHYKLKLSLIERNHIFRLCSALMIVLAVKSENIGTLVSKYKS